jgi:3-ketosteroid 9alpha-monooxygenase subunit A
MGVTPEMMKPSGWFQIGWSGDFAVGEVVPKRHFGAELVVYRTADGALHGMDAYCGHMGAHLAHGATVDVGCVTCPFHGWTWSHDGRNLTIPYQDRPNRAVRMRVWPVAERNGCVYVWHDRDGVEPAWVVPDVFDMFGPEVAGHSYHPSHPDGEIRFGPRRLNPYVVLDNSADAAHFAFVHGSSVVPTVVAGEPHGHCYKVRLGFGNSWRRDPATATGDVLDIIQVGVGLSMTALGSDSTPWSVIMLSTTPIDDTTSEMFQTVWLQEAEGDDEPGRLERRMLHATHQLPRDIEIWEHQRYVDRPAWAASETRWFLSLRRWASTFYAAG